MVSIVAVVAGALPGAVPAAAPHAVLVLVGRTTRLTVIVPNLLSLARLLRRILLPSLRPPPQSTEMLPTLMLKLRPGPPVRPLHGVVIQLPSTVLPWLPPPRLPPLRRLHLDRRRS